MGEKFHPQKYMDYTDTIGIIYSALNLKKPVNIIRFFEVVALVCHQFKRMLRKITTYMLTDFLRNVGPETA